MRTRILILAALAAGLLILTACSDSNDPRPAVRPDLVGTVTDSTGAPVAGVAIGLVYSLDGYPLPGDKPATQLRYTLPDSARFRLTIHDRAGALVRVLADGTYPPGMYAFTWDATDDEGLRVPAGMYGAHIVQDGNDGGWGEIFLYEWQPEAFLDMPNAVTDAQGAFRIPGELIAVGDSMYAASEVPEVIPDRVAVSPWLGVVAAEGDKALIRSVRVNTVYEPLANVDMVVDLVLPAP